MKSEDEVKIKIKTISYVKDLRKKALNVCEWGSCRHCPFYDNEEYGDNEGRFCNNKHCEDVYLTINPESTKNPNNRQDRENNDNYYKNIFIARHHRR